MSKYTLSLILCLVPFASKSGVFSHVVKSTVKTATVATTTLAAVALSQTSQTLVSDQPAQEIFQKHLINNFQEAYKGLKIAALHVTIKASEIYVKVQQSHLSPEGEVFAVTSTNNTSSENDGGL